MFSKWQDAAVELDAILSFNLLWNGFFAYHILQEVDITNLNKFWPILLNLIIVKRTEHKILGNKFSWKIVFRSNLISQIFSNYVFRDYRVSSQTFLLNSGFFGLLLPNFCDFSGFVTQIVGIFQGPYFCLL